MQEMASNTMPCAPMPCQSRFRAINLGMMVVEAALAQCTRHEIGTGEDAYVTYTDNYPRRERKDDNNNNSDDVITIS